MADIFELRLVANRCGGMSLVYEGRTYKVKYAGSKRVKCWGCSKVSGVQECNIYQLGCDNCAKADILHGNLPSGSLLSIQTEKKATLKKRSAEETKSIPEINNEETAAASVEPSISGQYPVLKQTAGNQHSLGIDDTFKIVPEWYQQLFTSHAFAAALINKAAVLEVDLNQQRVICDFGTALIPAIQRYFRNMRVQSCYFHFYQAVHSKVGELSLKTRYRTEKETKIKMLLATAFILVLQERMTDNRLPLWNVYNADFRTNNHLEGWHNQLNKNAGGNKLRQVSRVYAEKQRQVIRYTGKCTSGRRTLEQFLKSLMYLTPELI
ncbi:hypothetical protein T10_4293 [Trichinella papuae]|uniref:MULE transposase domain-containing protein n=1 Tax=Trichinella papuae TaxID=268474 RepID=A0A0V1ML68_9BILA|nr:hypothetical protein T10_4293 [Trichinella papuae]